MFFCANSSFTIYQQVYFCTCTLQFQDFTQVSFEQTWKNGAIKAQKKNFFLPHGLQWLCTKICFWFVNVVLVSGVPAGSRLVCTVIYWFLEVESRTQGLRPRAQKNPRPRAQKNLRPRTDPFEAKNRNARGQAQGPRTQRGSDFKKKRSSLPKFVNFLEHSGVLQKQKKTKKGLRCDIS